jgi:hypothetical protein
MRPMTSTLTPGARIALVGCGSHRPGTSLPAGTPATVVIELHTAGLIGPSQGLTSKGAMVRARIIDDALDAWTR